MESVRVEIEEKNPSRCCWPPDKDAVAITHSVLALTHSVHTHTICLHLHMWYTHTICLHINILHTHTISPHSQMLYKTHTHTHTLPTQQRLARKGYLWTHWHTSLKSIWESWCSVQKAGLIPSRGTGTKHHRDTKKKRTEACLSDVMCDLLALRIVHIVQYAPEENALIVNVDSPCRPLKTNSVCM